MAVCITHVDLDGYAAAALVSIFEESKVFIIPMNYGWDFDKDRIRKGEKVYITDLTMDLDTMKYLVDNYDVYWFDHHVEIVNDTELVIGADIPGYRRRSEDEPDKSGALLVWEYFNPGKEPPRALTLIDAYDIWEHQRHPFIIEFDRGIRTYDYFPIGMGKIELWKRIFFEDAFCDEIIDKGTQKWIEEKKENAAKCRFLCEEFDAFGYRALCMNTPMTDTYLFASKYDPEKHDILMTYYRYSKAGKTYWKVSLRNGPGKDINVQELAHQFIGGGGHKYSSGFSVDYIDEVPCLRHLVSNSSFTEADDIERAIRAAEMRANT